jgi:tol-pal system protein YbgF
MVRLLNGTLSRLPRGAMFGVCSAAALLTLWSSAVLAQQPAPGAQPRPQTKAAAPKASAEPAAQTSPSGDGGLRQRVEQLEEQLVDMQVTIGTLESLTKGAASSSSVFRGGSTPSGAASGGGGDSVRMDALEQQMRQLSSQLDQLNQQMRQMNNRQGAAPSQGAGALADADVASRPLRAQSAVIGGPAPLPLPNVATPAPDQIGRILAPAPGGAVADDGSPRLQYDTAQGYFLAQDYGAAEVAFDEFVKRYPNDALASNAQYWLGETYFLRGQFKPAASAFLKGYQIYAKSSKAPDSLLKLAMSLDRLDQKAAACSSFNELVAKYPNATAPVRNRAEAERRRLACT